MRIRPPGSTLLPYTTLFRSLTGRAAVLIDDLIVLDAEKSCREIVDDAGVDDGDVVGAAPVHRAAVVDRAAVDGSGAHAGELQSHSDLVCRLPLAREGGVNAP